MIKQLLAAFGQPCFHAIAIVCTLSACTPALEKKQALFDVAAVKQIEFKIGSIKSSSLTSTLSRQDNTTRIAKNLSDWGYPIAIKDHPAASHTLTAEIGLIEHGQTPSGFSFSAGNSDPRAIDFQKADVIPISCELTSVARPEQTVYLHMDFVVGNSLSKPVQSAISADKLVDHVSTVCFNLLSELKWPQTSKIEPATGIKPGWMPEVRIETVASPVAEGKANAPGTSVIQAEEGRKQIVIHNQGSPVIFSFGHER